MIQLIGMMGLTQTLGKEGKRAKKDLKANCIAPLAGTRMLEVLIFLPFIPKFPLIYTANGSFFM